MGGKHQPPLLDLPELWANFRVSGLDVGLLGKTTITSRNVPPFLQWRTQRSEKGGRTGVRQAPIFAAR